MNKHEATTWQMALSMRERTAEATVLAYSFVAGSLHYAIGYLPEGGERRYLSTTSDCLAALAAPAAQGDDHAPRV